MIVAPMTVDTRDTLMRTAAFEHVRRWVKSTIT